METRVKEGRTALAITILLVATLTVPAILLGNPASQAQPGPASPTGTAAAIELLNPSDYYEFSGAAPAENGTAGPLMSDEDTTDADSAREYHFAAVVANAPTQPTVEFLMIQGTQTVNLGPGTFGPNGSVSLVRDIPDVFDEGPDMFDPSDPDGTGEATVRAILYANGGQTEVDRDDQAVVLNQEDRSGEDQLDRGERDPELAAETVEILYPAHGGDFGLFKQGTTAAVGVFQVEWSTGTDQVSAYYTISPPDADPTWKNCNTGESTTAPAAGSTTASASDGVRCTLVDGDQPAQVTGVAAVARDSESDFPTGGSPTTRNNSGDAHRVVGYAQRPGIVTVTPQTLAANRINGCTDFLHVEVLDHTTEARPIAAAPVDVHAQGPTENLAFNTEPDEQHQYDPAQSDNSKAPDNHPTESGRNCADDTQDGTQGTHAVGQAPDRKHIESVEGTDDRGRFTFRLWSDGQGGTRVTGWADTTEDDRLCAGEVRGSEVVMWGTGNPAPAEEPSESTAACTSTASTSSASTSSASTSSASVSSASASSTSPSSSASSRSPSASASTASPTVTASRSPSGSQTPTSTSSTTTGTGGGTSSAAQAEREVTLEASKSRTTFGKTFTLSGSVTSSNPACTGGSVRILRDVLGGSDEFELFAQETADSSGTFSLNVDADKSANYVAQVQETDTCGEASSSSVPVLVRVQVSLSASDSRVRRGQRVRLTIRTAPCPETARDKVLLFRAIEGQFGKVGRKTSSATCKATFVRRVRQTSVFQGRWPKQAPEYIAGKSRSKAVRVTN